METMDKNVDLAFISGLYKHFTEELAIVEEEATLKHLAEKVGISIQYVRKLREYIVALQFENAADEIRFFKYHKPKFYSHLIYYSEVYGCELNVPMGSIQSQKEYYTTEINRLRNEFEKNREFYTYFRTGENHKDELFFLRDRNHNIICNGILREIDPEFSTGFDLLAACYWAYEKLADYINKKITGLENARVSFDIPIEAPRLVWTDSKSALIELVYAFKARGSFNNGKATLKDLVDFVRRYFGVELTNPTRDFQEVLRRKAGYTLYLDGLKESYLQYIDKNETRERR